jgi:hypothetical protein
VIAAISSGIVAWSIATTFQRAVLVAIGAGTSARTLRQAIREAARHARALVVLGAALGAYSVVLATIGMIGVVLGTSEATEPFVVGLALCSWCFLGWMISRPFLGIATASIVLGGDTALAACLGSVRHLAGHRASTLSTRRNLLLPAAAASALFSLATTTAVPSPWWLVATVAFLPVVVSLDAVVEAAWYDRLRARVDVQNLAAVFS